MPSTSSCSRCGEAYLIADGGAFGHACADGKSVIAGTAWKAYDIYDFLSVRPEVPSFPLYGPHDLLQFGRTQVHVIYCECFPCTKRYPMVIPNPLIPLIKDWGISVPDWYRAALQNEVDEMMAFVRGDDIEEQMYEEELWRQRLAEAEQFDCLPYITTSFTEGR